MLLLLLTGTPLTKIILWLGLVCCTSRVPTFSELPATACRTLVSQALNTIAMDSSTLDSSYGNTELDDSKSNEPKDEGNGD